ncbi:MAG: C69 family dipeptidase, partial [Myxococcales bacterium]|nr:C69 family dipeptidase [Myxococcales bacterium]
MLMLMLPVAAASPAARASYAFYVGKNLTEAGVVMVGGSGEEVSSHWLEIVPARDHPAGATVVVGVTAAAGIPGALSEIPQVRHTARYLSMSYTEYEGFPAPLTNGGVNEHLVAVRDVWAPSRDELLAMTPTPQRGPQYSDLARLVLERAKTAREGVELIGALIAKYGYSTYGGNTHMIADPTEGWVVWEFAGGAGLWAAERLGPDAIRVLYPGYIEEFPSDFRKNPDFMGSDNIVQFAIEQGWYDPKSGEPFNVFEVYGNQRATAREGGFAYMSQAALEAAVRDMAPVSERDLMDRLRDKRITDDHAGYGQVVSLRPGLDADLIRIWVAPTGSVAAPFIPWWLGVQQIPVEFGAHRYLTAGSSSTFLNNDFQLQEASDFAGRRFKQVLYYMCEKPAVYHPAVTEMLEGFERASMADLPWIERSAQTLIHKGQREDARRLLTFYSQTRARDAMQLGSALVGWLRASAELVTGVRRPTQPGPEISRGKGLVTCLEGIDPDTPADAQ